MPSQNYDDIPEPIMVVNKDLCLVQLNQAAEQFWGRSKTVVLNSELASVLGPNQELLGLCQHVANSGASLKGFDIRVDRRFVGMAVCDVSVSLMNDQGDLLMLLSRRAKTLQTVDAKAGSNVTESMHHLVNMLAHEIKNPLAGIKGAGQLLLMSAGENDRDLVALVIEESDRLTALVDQFDFFSNSLETPKGFVNIHEILARVESIALNSFGKHVTFTKIYDPSLPEIFGDRDALVQVMLNLVKNACEALEGQNQASISIYTQYEHGHMAMLESGRAIQAPVQIIIQDNGPGIPEDIQRKVFEPFRSGKGKDKDKGKDKGRGTGMGLGLSIVSKILADHQSAIRFDSCPGETSFCVSFPVISE